MSTNLISYIMQEGHDYLTGYVFFFKKCIGYLISPSNKFL